jgi:hypothetical protein
VPTEQAPNAVLALILAIVSFAACGIFTSVPALIIARLSLNDYPNCGLSKAAYWVAFANLAFIAAIVLAYCGFVALMFGTLGASSSGHWP